MRSAGLGAVAGGVAVLVLGGAVAAQAAWSDSATANSGSVGAFALVTPVARCAGLQIGSTDVRWAAVPGATGYRVHYGSGASQSEDVGPGVTTYRLLGLVTGGTFRVEALRDYPQVEWRSPPSNDVTYTNLLALLGTCSD